VNRAAPIPASAVASLPWGAWHGDARLDLDFPRGWEVEIAPSPSAPALDPQAVIRAIRSPVGSPPLSELAAGKASAAIAVDDLSRPAAVPAVLDALWQELKAAGLKADAVRIVVASGSHRPLERRELHLKLGAEAMGRHPIYGHHPFENLADTGVLLGKVPLRVNRFFHEAQLRIGVSTVTPHPFAGFSGGAKIVLPGLASLDVLERTHKFVLMGLRGGIGAVDGNRFREEAEDAVRAFGLHFSVNLVVNGRRAVAGLAAGDLRDAHRAAVEIARRVYAAPCSSPGSAPSSAPKSDGADAVVLNAYPKDMDLIQADFAFNPLRWLPGLVKPEGVVVLTSACPLGRGVHGLFEPGMRLHRKPSARGFLGGRTLLVHSPELSAFDFHDLYWEGYELHGEWRTLRERLEGLLPGSRRVLVFPCAPIQIPVLAPGRREGA